MTDRIYNDGKLYIKKYNAYAFLLCAFICRQSLLTYFSAFLNKIPFFSFFSHYFIPSFIVILMIVSFKPNVTRFMRFSDCLVPMFIIIDIVAMYLFSPQNVQYYLFNFDTYVLYCVPAFFVGLFAVDYNEDTFTLITKVSCVAVLASYVLLVYYSYKNISLSGDDMGMSYAVVLSTLFIISYYFYTHRTIYLVFAILGLVYALILGTRGPLVILVTYIIACYLLNSLDNMKVVILTLLWGVVIIAFIKSTHFTQLLDSINSTILRAGYSTRIIDSFMSGNLFSSNSRDAIYITLYEKLSQRPLSGYGLFGEWQFVNWNAHNLYLEVVFEYGWPIGILLIVFYLKTVLSAFFVEKDKTKRYFMMVFIFFVLIQGLRGYSHLRPELFLLLGYCLMQRRIQRSQVLNLDNINTRGNYEKI